MKQTILFLRNASLFGSKEAALAAIKSVNHVAGQPVVALYGSEGSVKMIFAIGTEAGKCNILANDSDLSELAGLVSGLRTDLGTSDNKGAAFTRIATLEGQVGSLLDGDDSVESQISTAIEALKGEGFEAGTLAALEDKVDANTNAIALLNDKEGKEGSIAKAIADSAAATKSAYEAADAKLKSDLEEYANKAEDDAIAAAKGIVEGLAVSESGKYVSKIEKDATNGKVTATLKQIEASEVAITDANEHFAATTVEAALEELYSQAGAGSKVTMKSEAGEGDIATIYTFYQGGEDADHKIGEINIGKEMFIESGEVIEKEGVPYLKLVLNDAANTVLEIDLTKVLDVYTAGNGINVDANVISIKKASDSEDFLVVDENGIAIKGVTSAISTAKSEAIAAAKTETENQVKAAKDAIDAYTVNGKAISSNPILGGADINYAEGVTVNAKIDEVAKAVADEKARAEEAEDDLQKAIEKAQAAASTEIKPKADGHVTVSVEEDKDDGHKIYTITEEDIASAQALAGEINRATEAELALTEIAEGIDAEVKANKGKVMIADGGELGYLTDKLVSGTANGDNNTYAVSVNASGDKLNLTCKIDVIDGGTY